MPILYLGFFLKPMSPQGTGRQLSGNAGIVSLRKFRDNEACIQLGQESPLMRKKGLRLPAPPRVAANTMDGILLEHTIQYY
jgi:hypothetical protein